MTTLTPDNVNLTDNSVLSEKNLRVLANRLLQNHPRNLRIGSQTTLSPSELACVFLPDSRMVVKQNVLLVEDSESFEEEGEKAETFSLPSEVIVCVDDSDDQSIVVLEIGATKGLDDMWTLHHIRREIVGALYTKSSPLYLTDFI